MDVGICALGRGAFFNEVAQCSASNCNSGSINLSQFLNGVYSMCSAIGDPISSAAVASAEAVGSSTLPYSPTASTTAFTTTTAVAQTTPVFSQVASAAGLTTTTALAQGTNSAGQLETLAVPVIYDSTTTFYGQPVEVSAGGLSPTTSRALSATFADTTLFLPSVTTPTGGSTSATNSPETTSAASTEGNGSLFTSQNAGVSYRAGSLFGLVVGLIASMLWF